MQWISVKERMPEIGERVLIYQKGCLFEIDYIDYGDVWESQGIHSKITHWMPMPECPKKLEET